MGYFSEQSIALQEQQEALELLPRKGSTGTRQQILPLLWRLEDLKTRLRTLIDRDETERPEPNRPHRSWSRIYQSWQDYRESGSAEVFFQLPEALESVPDVLRAIAETQQRLFFWGYDADAEARRLSRPSRPLDGQMGLPLAS